MYLAIRHLSSLFHGEKNSTPRKEGVAHGKFLLLFMFKTLCPPLQLIRNIKNMLYMIEVKLYHCKNLIILRVLC